MLRRRLSGSAVASLLTSVVAAVVLLGPALGPGVVLSYDLAVSPDARWTPFTAGIGASAPRAVPSDAVNVLLGEVLGAEIAQKVILLGVLVLAGTGAAHLLGRVSRPPVGAVVATTVAALWNPYVAERLAIGQWTTLLGYAVLPWAFAAVLAVRRASGGTPREHHGQSRSPVPMLLAWTVFSGLAGAYGLVVVVPSVMVALLAPRARLRAALGVLVVAAGVAGAWLLPSLAVLPASDPSASRLFAAAADTPWGLLPSLVGGGGVWNVASWPVGRSAAGLSAVATVATIAACAYASRRLFPRGRGRSLVLAAWVSLAVTAVAALSAGTTWWADLVALPGGGLLRDSQRLVAAWVLCAVVGVGLSVDAMYRRVSSTQARVGVGRLVSVGAVALTVAVLPGAAWGHLGRLAAVDVPSGYREAAAWLSRQPAGVVGALPWHQYRRYGWNDHRVSLSPAARAIAQPVLFDDDLPTRGGTVAGEDPRSAAVTVAIARGVAPARALADAGAAYLWVEHDSGLAEPDVAGSGPVVYESAQVTVVRLEGAAALPTVGAVPPWVRWAGWSLSLLTLAVTLLALGSNGRLARAANRGRGDPRRRPDTP